MSNNAEIHQLLEKLKSNLTQVVGLLDQVTFQGQNNTIIMYNVFGFLGNTIGEITNELDVQKLNSETPQKEGKK